jgi:phosphoribosyl-ATP pyrophosphohydrolase/phosphoribosyl-AMP cyclohydrolase
MIQFEKYADGLVPAIIQDGTTKAVLMLGFMNKEAYEKTLQSGKITFFSRSRNKIWVKGETSGNFLLLQTCRIDCDEDTLLFEVKPTGPVCHTGTDTCFGAVNQAENAFFPDKLMGIIESRLSEMNPDSYTVKLYEKGITKVAQKVGEEAVEVLIEALEKNKEKLAEETADLLYHLSLLLKMSDVSYQDVFHVLQKRNQKK